MLKLSAVVLIVGVLLCCRDDSNGTNPAPSFRQCNSLLSNCGGLPDGEYCLLGYKWGDGNPFLNAGPDANGPMVAGGTIAFGFYEAGQIVHTHSQDNVATIAFEEVTVCDAKEQIKAALATWSALANLEFEEVAIVEDADIKFAVAKIAQGGVGFPAFTDDLCSVLAGQVVLNINRSTCDSFRNLALHEIGHALGLGHVSSNNIMNPNYNQSATQPGTGDINGIQAIYGTR